jgi:hypothetical protein
MTLRLSPAILEAAYEFLRVTSPFRGWKLPHADEVEFTVSRDPTINGAHSWHIDGPEAGTHCIYISEVRVGHIATLIRIMAHEMVHLHLKLSGKTDAGEHGANFQRCAAIVARHHGYDPKEF